MQKEIQRTEPKKEPRKEQRKKQRKGNLLQWHPAFYADIRIELRKEAEKLVFENEHQLGTKPKEIDVLIIKKKGSMPIEKNIGRIFRGHNIVEYKAPGDYFSLDAYYKVFGYACFYKADVDSQNKIPIDDITITLVSHSYPRKLMEHLQHDRGHVIEQIEEGIYYVYGELFPT